MQTATINNVVPLKKKGKAAPAINVMDVLNQATVKPETKGKSKVPILTVNEDTMQLAGEIRDLKAQIDSLKSQFETKEAEILAQVTPERERLCKLDYQSSIKVPDLNGMTILISWKDQYTKIPIDTEQNIKQIIDGKYQDYFEPEMQITVKKEALTEDALKELITKIGVSEFSKFFDVERWIKPTSRYTREQFAVFTPEQRQALTMYVKQYKPAIK
ncbi:MAG: hypothetical protein ABIF11_11680 [Nitrospirota bacterium]